LNIELDNYSDDVILSINYKAMGVSTTFNCGMMSNVIKVIHHHVSDDFDLKEEYEKLADTFKLNLKRTIIFLTAADVRSRHILYECECEGVHTIISLTAGFTNPYVIKNGEVHSMLKNSKSTINIAVFIDRKLNQGAMIDAIRTVSEAKSASLFELTGGSMHGTTSDAIAVITKASGKEENFAGPFTPVGKSITMAVYRALSIALRNS